MLRRHKHVIPGLTRNPDSRTHYLGINIVILERANIALLLHAQGKVVPARHTEAGDVIIYNYNHGIWEVNGRQVHTKDLLVHI